MATTSHCTALPPLKPVREFVLVGRATSLAGPYVVDVDAGPVFGTNEADCFAEDPFMFRNQRGFHVIAHGANLYDINNG